MRIRLTQTPPPQTRLSAWSIQQAGHRSDWFRKQAVRAETALKEAGSTLKERERSLRQARRELRKFELLKERRQSEWQAHALKLEQKQLDEVGSRLRRAAQIADLHGKLGPAPSASTL
jgi:flagellar export protein FliJ